MPEGTEPESDTDEPSDDRPREAPPAPVPEDPPKKGGGGGGGGAPPNCPCKVKCDCVRGPTHDRPSRGGAGSPGGNDPEEWKPLASYAGDPLASDGPGADADDDDAGSTAPNRRRFLYENWVNPRPEEPKRSYSEESADSGPLPLDILRPTREEFAPRDFQPEPSAPSYFVPPGSYVAQTASPVAMSVPAPQKSAGATPPGAEGVGTPSFSPSAYGAFSQPFAGAGAGVLSGPFDAGGAVGAGFAPPGAVPAFPAGAPGGVPGWAIGGDYGAGVGGAGGVSGPAITGQDAMLPPGAVEARSAAWRLPTAPSAQWAPVGVAPPAMPVVGSDAAPTSQPQPATLDMSDGGPAVPAPAFAATTLAPPGSMRFSAPPPAPPFAVVAAPAAGNFAGGAMLGPGAGVGVRSPIHQGDGSVAAGLAVEVSRRPVSSSGSALSPRPWTSEGTTAVRSPAQQGLGSFAGAASPGGPLPRDSISDVPWQRPPAFGSGGVSPLASEAAPESVPGGRPQRPPKPPKPPKPSSIGPAAEQRGKGGKGIGAFVGAATAAANSALARKRLDAIPGEVARLKSKLGSTGTSSDEVRERVIALKDGVKMIGGQIDKLAAEYKEPGTSDSRRSEIAAQIKDLGTARKETQSAFVSAELLYGAISNPKSLSQADLTNAERRELEALAAQIRADDLTRESVKKELDEIAREEAELSDGVVRLDQEVEDQLPGLAEQFGVTVDEMRVRIGDPKDSLSKRALEEGLRQVEQKKAEERRDAARTKRLRYGEDRSQAQALLHDARSARDQTSVASRALASFRPRTASSVRIKKASRKALGMAATAAKAAKQAAKAYKRLTQYGTGDAVAAAKQLADNAKSVSNLAQQVVALYAKAAHVAANPISNAVGQKALVNKAEAKAKHEAAQLALALMGAKGAIDVKAWDAALDRIAAESKALADAEREFGLAMRNGDIGPEHTTWPDCPHGYLPKDPAQYCDVSCLPGYTLVFRWGRGDDPSCKKYDDPYAATAEPAGGKGKGPPQVEGSTSDSYPEAPPPPPPLAPPTDHGATWVRIDDNTQMPPDRVFTPEATLRLFHSDDPQAWRGKGTLVQPGEYGRPPKSPSQSEAGIGPEPANSRIDDKADVDSKNQPKRKRTVTELRAERFRQVLSEFVQEMARRARVQDAAIGRAEQAAWEKLVFDAIDSNFKEIEKLVETRLTVEETLATLAAEVASGDVSSERRQKIDLLASKLELADAQAKFDMVEKAGARQLRDSIQEAVDVVDAAMAADRLHREAGVEDPGFLDSTTHLMPAVGDILRNHDRANTPAATAARAAWSDSEPGVADFLKNLWINATGGPDASTGERIAIFAATVAIGLATAGAGSVAMAGMSTLARVGMTALVGVAEGALQSAARQAIMTIDDPDGIKINAKEAIYEGLVSGAFAGLGAATFGKSLAKGEVGRRLTARVDDLIAGAPEELAERLRFSQVTARTRFSDAGATQLGTDRIDELAARLRAGEIDPASVKIGVTTVDGETLLIDNTRSALALRRAGIPESEWNLVNATNELRGRRKTFGETVISRLETNKLTPEGTDVLLITDRPFGKGVLKPPIDFGRPKISSILVPEAELERRAAGSMGPEAAERAAEVLGGIEELFGPWNP